jgi:hypothetical protein
MHSIRSQIINVNPIHGLNATLSEMKRLESLSFHVPSFLKFVHETFGGCIACYPGKIWEYMRKNFTFIPDEYDETITAPYILLQTKQGDCDDFALFSKTVLDILGGWNTNYLLLGRTLGGYSHVATFANRGRSLFKFIDPVVIDGANNNFNTIKSDYRYSKLVS